MPGLNDSINREKKISEIAEVIYAENRNKGLPADPMRDWKEAEKIFDDKAVYYCLWLPTRFVRKYFYKILAVSVPVIVILLMWNLRYAQDMREINIRPYVSVDMIDPVQINDGENKNVYFGNYIILNNTGKTPASNVSARYYLTSEADRSKPAAADKKWVDERMEGVSSMGFIAPGTFIKEPSFKALSPSAKYYYFEAIVSYKGQVSSKRYWTHVRKMYQFDKASGKFMASLNNVDWDMNSSFVAPPMSSAKEIDGFMMKIADK
ncbi:MAG: hypothetical protein WC324_03335 [Candidatus Omnitrophota bacterium]|jgi:hypothetical protein